MSPLAQKIAKLNSLISEAENLGREILDECLDDTGRFAVPKLKYLQLGELLELIETVNANTLNPEDYENL